MRELWASYAYVGTPSAEELGGGSAEECAPRSSLMFGQQLKLNAAEDGPALPLFSIVALSILAIAVLVVVLA